MPVRIDAIKIFALFIIVLLSACKTQQPESDTNIHLWSKVTAPTLSPTEIYGSYSSGCIAGAEPIDKTSPYYNFVSNKSNGNFGHPTMHKFLNDFTQLVYRKFALKLNISDIGQPRGGPFFNSDHFSHQTGLDVDIWFNSEDIYQNAKQPDTSPSCIHNAAKTSASCDSLPQANYNKPIKMTKGDQVNEKLWPNEMEEILRLASNYQNVNRIFVNPAIKQYLCSKYKGNNWLNKIRPWYGHNAHFHIRLNCPADMKNCLPQAPLPQGDGCDATLAWWFSAEAKAPTAAKPVKKTFHLPKQCAGLLSDM